MPNRVFLATAGLTLAGACATDFGRPGDYLPCDSSGACVEGFACVKVEGLGSVCLNDEQRRVFCDQPEICDGLDNDCDGLTDEGEDGQPLVRSCYDGLPATNGIGPCHGGSATCAAGAWSSCEGQVLPTDEICDGLDNDCDGQTDELVTPRLSGSAIGECKLTIEECVRGAFTVTQPGVEWTPERCDGRDNDCDGATDNGFPELGVPCERGEGACRAAGAIVCSADQLGTTCNAVPSNPSAELCDGLDNNCDGATDETFAELGQSCSVGVGECRATGVRVCRDDAFGTQCDAQALEPTAETCDGLDNNCNGQIDDGLGDACCIPGTSRSCGINLGACTVGQQECRQDRSWGVCSGRAPIAETCNGADDDCDGSVDEDLANCCTPGASVACSITRGACVAGQQFCQLSHVWSSCSGVLPSTEICDGLDNDCDGATDEDFQTLGRGCSVGRGSCAASGTIVCSANRLSAVCSALEGQPTEEVCDGLDNDCDGEVDEGLVRRVGTDEGECQQGIERCDGGHYVIVQTLVEPTTESCDGLDNDCDGATDEDAPACCSPGESRTCGLNRGECSIGRQVCSSQRSWSDCSGRLPIDEFCDGLDNDCDGQTDEEWSRLIGNQCAAGQGICTRTGIAHCAADGNGIICDATPGNPGTEICDGLDNDCDGQTDEFDDLGFMFEGSDVGECSPRILACARGEWVEVRPAIGPTAEICDGRDNDCNGTADNGITSASCYEGPIGSAGVGVCRSGSTVCVGGVLRCIGQVLPAVELCDGLDNDCDGVVDGSLVGAAPVALTQPCYSGPQGTLGIGECHAGTTRCSGGLWGACTGDVTPTTASGDCASCRGLRALGFVDDGIYTIVLGGSATRVYCDMATDSGGWTLVLAYAHPAGANDPLVIGTAPTDSVSGYSHMSTAQLNGFPWSELRFYCETSAHARKIHFKTSVAGAVAYIAGRSDNRVEYWNTGFTPLEEHTAFLPGAANDSRIGAVDEQMMGQPFVTNGIRTWTIRVQGFRWECDDGLNSFAYATLHQVWVR